MYYGYRCYDSQGEPLGWLYTFENNTEYAWTDKNLTWCKRWKTERGARKNFNNYNSRWQFASKGGYLTIAVMPDIPEPESAQSRALKLLEEWGDDKERQADLTLLEGERDAVVNAAVQAAIAILNQHGLYADIDGEMEVLESESDRKLKRI
ncbi:hypothetical protein AB0758_33875 [Tolypothrix bouteillei VB521301_2]|uniref:hypothetical protein n=1 Tax=Tolypothrix bouteillei TaxID=1246981 RepID=UPI0038B507FF